MRVTWAMALFVATFAVNAADKHLGVASCSNGVCHGSAQAFDKSNVMQNEFVTWQENDPHAKAYEILLNADSQRIARNLNIGPAEQAPMCLTCHADYVPEAQRGEKFQLSDGVGCEGCHGGSERWIAAHAAKDASHAKNLELGLYPTDQPIARAEKCLSCHMGDRDKKMTHAIMGAGHPRLSFELDTFTWLDSVVHYQIDDDYLQRKGEFNGVRDWAVGQGIAAKNLLENLTDPRTAGQGIFPELTLFDCHACHRPMNGKQWAPRVGTGLGPGVVRLNDSNLVIFRLILRAIDPGAAETIAAQTRAMHRSTLTDKAALLRAANALKASIDRALPAVADNGYDESLLKVVLNKVVDEARRGEYRDYAAAEQATMAVQSLVVAFETLSGSDAPKVKALNAQIDGLYKIVENDNAYQPARFVSALEQLARSAP
jgi:hypothetical protein